MISAVGLLARIYYIGKIPDGHQEKENTLFGDGIADALSNKSLSGFSVYICCLYLAAYSTLPLTFIYIKKYLMVADNIIIVISSSMAFCGSCYAAGVGGSRLLTSLILGSGILAPEWFLGSIKFSHYQTLFLVYGCAITFVCLLLVLVPAIFPKGNYRYMPH